MYDAVVVAYDHLKQILHYFIDNNYDVFPLKHRAIIQTTQEYHSLIRQGTCSLRHAE